MANEIKKVSSEVKAVEEFTKEDIAKPVRAQALIQLYDERNEQKKEIDEEVKILKNEINRLFDFYTDGPMAVCDYEGGRKISREYARKESREITEEDLLVALCAYYDEDINDRSGKAWDAFKSVTDPVVIPRKLNEEKLACALLGQNKKIPEAVLENPDVVKVKPATYKIVARNISKTAQKNYEAGKIDSCLEIEE